MWLSFFWPEETLSLCPQIPGGVSLRVGSGREPPGQNSRGGVGAEHQIVGPWPLDRGDIVEVEAGLPWPGHY